MRTPAALLSGAVILSCLACDYFGSVSSAPTGPAVSGVYITNAFRVQLTVGDTFDLQVVYTGNDRQWEVAQWIVSNPSLATVTPGGTLIAVAPGVSDASAQISSTRGPGSAVGSFRVLEPPAFVAHRVVSVSDRACAARAESVELVCWSYGLDETGVAFPPRALAGAPDFRQLDLGGSHSCGVAADSTAYCWGWNDRGQLGTGDSLSRAVPTPVTGGRKWLRVSVGSEFSCGLAADSTAYCWGYGLSGHLGNGAEVSAPVPSAVATDAKFISLDVGSYHTCGVRLDGGVLCWGDHSFTRTGAFGVTPVLEPRLIENLPAMTRVAVASNHSCAVSVDGVAWCWGLGGRGQTGRAGGGDPYGGDPPAPVSGTATPPLVFIAADDARSCGLTAAGAAWCWGERPLRERIHSGHDGFSTPTAVPGGIAFESIDLGSWIGCGITTSGDVMCWGNNTTWQVGDGTNINRLRPKRVRP